MGCLCPKVEDDTRRIQIDSEHMNYASNYVQTTKYSVITFFPKALLLQFTRLSNIVYLLNSFLSSITIISSVSPFTAIGPLAFVLSVSLLREGYEDYKRHKKDQETNEAIAHRFEKGQLKETQWQELKVGHLVKVLNGQAIPADLILLYSTDENKICYVETANLDGESNLKERHVIPLEINLSGSKISRVGGTFIVESPRSDLNGFQGSLRLEDDSETLLDFRNLLLRGTVLRNTNFIVGLAIYCGKDTRINMNQGFIHHKISRVESKINRIQVALVVFLFVLCAGCSGGYYATHVNYNLRASSSYVPILVSTPLYLESGLVFLTTFLILNFLIPITLNIIIEGIKTLSGVFLSMDSKMIDPKSQRGCGVLNTSIVEELGCIDYILTDKTGTLTSNQMVFRTVVIQNHIYTSQEIESSLHRLQEDRDFHKFWLSVIVCHDVVRDFEKDQFQGSSPDEVCFMNYARQIGFEFVKRSKNAIQLRVQGETVVYELLEIIHFTSRKRMSVIVRKGKTEQIMMFTKGADGCMLNKCSKESKSTAFRLNIDNFAKDGLRTLVFGFRKLTSDIYIAYAERKADIANQYRKRLLSKAEIASHETALVQEIESFFDILGATGIEDRLQDEVPATISRLQEAGIRIMMVTGDKLETAENIGYLTQLIKSHFQILRLVSDESDLIGTARRFLERQQNYPCDWSLIIEGASISRILETKERETAQIYKEMFTRCKSVIFCRSSPKEKADIVRFVKMELKGIVLAIGDGGNDVSMIEEAHVGVGILGKEGNSAAVVADFNFFQFKYLDRLVLHHGRWFFTRLSYFFVYFGWKNLIITLMIFFYEIDCAFSGQFNFTQLYFGLFNTIFVIGLSMNVGLFDQDVNDDQHTDFWFYLPRLYKQCKEGDLFSYKRYIAWTVVGTFIALVLYYTIQIIALNTTGVDQMGRAFDLKLYKIISGIILVLVIHIVIYFDTRTHNVFFEVFVMIIGSIVPSVSFYLGENYIIAFPEVYGVYTDFAGAFRLWAIVFLIFGLSLVIKIGMSTFFVEYYPTSVDSYFCSDETKVFPILDPKIRDNRLCPIRPMDPKLRTSMSELPQ